MINISLVIRDLLKTICNAFSYYAENIFFGTLLITYLLEIDYIGYSNFGCLKLMFENC